MQPNIVFLLLLVVPVAWGAQQVRVPSETDYNPQQRWLKKLRNGARFAKRSKSSSVFGPVRNSAPRHGGYKKRKAGKGKGYARSPISLPTVPVSSPTTYYYPVPSPVSPSPVSAPPVSAPSYSFMDLMGKGKGKMNGGKSSKKGRWGNQSSKKSKKGKKRNSACRDFEFNLFRGRRGLQFDGTGCDNNILDVASRIPELQRFVDALHASGLADIFSCGGPFTVVAPTNSAFDQVDVSSADPDELRTFLLSHIVPGILLADDFENGSVEGMAGNFISVQAQPLAFNSASALQRDIIGCNGVLFPTNSFVTTLGDDLDLCSFVDGNTTANSYCEPNLLDAMRQTSDLSLAYGLLERAGLTSLLRCGVDFTFLAPSNSAIRGLPSELLDQLLAPENIQLLRANLLYHVIPGLYLSSDLDVGSLDTLFDGYSIPAERYPVKFAGVVASSVDNKFCNGIFHILDDVLRFADGTALDQLQGSGTDGSNGGSTGGSTGGNAGSGSGGTFLDCSKYDFGGNASCSPNLFDLAKTEPELAFAVELIGFANLTGIFGCPGPFTGIFPNNDAFVALGQDFILNLTKPENLQELQELLLYHILPGNMSSSDFQSGSVDTLVDNANVSVVRDPSSNNITFNNETLLSQDDLQSCNGAIHVIGSVLDVRKSDLAQGPSSGTARVKIDRFYMAYVSKDAIPPTAAQYETLRSETAKYFDTLLRSVVPGFMGIEMNLDFTRSGAAADALVDVPHSDSFFNIYLEFSTAEAFFDSSGVVPTGDKMIGELVNGMTADFLINIVRKIENTPFTKVNEGWVAYTSK